MSKEQLKCKCGGVLTIEKENVEVWETWIYEDLSTSDDAFPVEKMDDSGRERIVCNNCLSPNYSIDSAGNIIPTIINKLLYLAQRHVQLARDTKEFFTISTNGEIMVDISILVAVPVEATVQYRGASYFPIWITKYYKEMKMYSICSVREAKDAGLLPFDIEAKV